MALKREELDSIHDTLYDIYGEDFTDKEIEKFWEDVPEDIKLDAQHWGLMTQ